LVEEIISAGIRSVKQFEVNYFEEDLTPRPPSLKGRGRTPWDRVAIANSQ
jgi:hypothetical protein